MAGHDIIVIGTSAGGLPALVTVAGGLPADLEAAIFVVMHTSADHGGALPQILAKAGPLPAAHAKHGEAIRHGRIYVAPPDHHLLLTPRSMRLGRGPRENRFRPAVDPLFRSAARSYGNRVIGIVLSGGLNDGTQGLVKIKQHGGVAMVQEPDDALIASMPRSAIRHVDVDYILAAADMAAVLQQLVRDPIPPEDAPRPAGEQDTPDPASSDPGPHDLDMLDGPPSALTCPECGGAIWELRDDRLLRFRCHVGHGFTAETLAHEQAERLEAALWSALRNLQETATLKRKMAGRAESVQMDAMARVYEEQAREAERHAGAIRAALLADDMAALAPPLASRDSELSRLSPVSRKPTAGSAPGKKPSSR